MTDRVFIENLHLRCRIGIAPRERRRAQEVVLDVSLFLDLEEAGANENIGASVNYKDAMARISGYVTGGQFTLLEGLAEGMARELLDCFAVDVVRVKVRKARYETSPSLGVEIERTRGLRSGH